MEHLDPALQKAITDALTILIPVLVSWVVAKITAAKATISVKKDTDAAFLKLRAHEEQLGIETKVVGGVISVSSRTVPGQAVPGPS